MPPWDKYQASAPTAQAASGPWERYGGKTPPAARGVLGTIDDTVRMIANGATFGYADEIAAKAGAATGIGGTRGDYAGNVAAERARDDDVMARMPVTSMAAKILGAVISPANRLIGSAVGAVRAPGYLNYAMQGGLGGSLAGSGESTEGNRGTGALTGGAFGAAFGAGVPALLSGAQTLARTAVDRFSAPATQFGRRLMTALERDGISIDDAINHLRGLGDDAAIADLGGNVRGLAEATAQMPGRSMHAAEQLRQRAFGQGERIINGALRVLGVNSLDDLIAQRSQAARPLYERALGSRVPVTSARIERLVQNPEVQRGIRQGLTVIRNEADALGVPMRFEDYAITGFNDAGDPVISGVPTLRLLDAAKRGLDDILQSGGDRVRDQATNRLTQYGRSIEQLRSTLVRELDGLTDGTYRAAREAWSGPSDVINALSLITRTVERSRDGADVTGRLFGSPDARNTLRRLFPSDEAFEQFGRIMGNERVFAETNRAIAGNSRTAFRQAAQNDMAGNAVDAAFDVAQNPTAANLMAQGVNMARNWWRSPPTAVADQATPLFSTDPATREAALNALRQRVGGQQLLDRAIRPLLPGGTALNTAARIGGYSGGQLGAYR